MSKSSGKKIASCTADEHCNHPCHHCCQAIKSLADVVCAMHCEACCGGDEDCCTNLDKVLDLIEEHVSHLRNCCADQVVAEDTSE